MQPEQRGGANAGAAVKVNGVADLLPLLRGVPVTYRFTKHNVSSPSPVQPTPKPPLSLSSTPRDSSALAVAAAPVSLPQLRPLLVDSY